MNFHFNPFNGYLDASADALIYTGTQTYSSERDLSFKISEPKIG